MPETASGNPFGVCLQDGAAQRIRARFGLGPDEVLRISYIPGPGDMAGTFQHWLKRENDPRVPIITYSAQFYELAEQIGASVQVLTIGSLPEADETLKGRARFRFDKMEIRAWKTRREYFQAQKAYQMQVERHVADFDPQVVLVSSDVPSASWKTLSRGRHLILTAHNTYWPMGRIPKSPKDVFRLLRLALQARALDDAVCTSQECARQIGILTRDRVKGLAQFPQVIQRHEERQIPQIRNLLFLGRIERNKGIFMLLEAVMQLQSECPDLSLTFAGSGTAADALAGRIRDGGARNIRYVGRLGAADVHAALHAADLLVCPTTSKFNEGLAVVGFEAAAHGVPTLMSSVVPAAEELGDACRVFAADSPRELLAALRDLVMHPQSAGELVGRLSTARETLYDRSRSWGSQLGRVMLRA